MNKQAIFGVDLVDVVLDQVLPTKHERITFKQDDNDRWDELLTYYSDYTYWKNNEGGSNKELLLLNHRTNKELNLKNQIFSTAESTGINQIRPIYNLDTDQIDDASLFQGYEATNVEMLDGEGPQWLVDQTNNAFGGHVLTDNDKRFMYTQNSAHISSDFGDLTDLIDNVATTMAKEKLAKELNINIEDLNDTHNDKIWLLTRNITKDFYDGVDNNPELKKRVLNELHFQKITQVVTSNIKSKAANLQLSITKSDIQKLLAE